MGAEVSFIPVELSVSCSNGVVRVRYATHIETEVYSGETGVGETDVVDEEVMELVKKLIVLIKTKLEESAGIGEAQGTENPLGDESPMGPTEEPL